MENQENQDDSEDFIKYIDIRLHPTFHPSKIILNRKPFEIRRIGWGWFRIYLTIYFHEKYNKRPLSIYHDLCFEGNGGWYRQFTNFIEKILKKLNWILKLKYN